MDLNENKGGHLQELGGSDFKIVEGQSNIKGWTVKDGAGNTIGEVAELLFDPESRDVRYIVLDLAGNYFDMEPKDVLIPIGLAELHDNDDEVIIPTINSQQLSNLPAYESDNFGPEIEERTAALFNGSSLAGSELSGNVLYDHDHFREENLYKRRRVAELRQTVIGIFNNGFEAQNAISELKLQGFHDNQVDLSVKDESSNDHETGVSGYFSKLFESEAQASHFTELAKRGSVVSVHTKSSEEAIHAAKIMDEHGAAEIDERHQENMDLGSPTGEFNTGSLKSRSRIVNGHVEESMRLRSGNSVNIARLPLGDTEIITDDTVKESAQPEVPVLNEGEWSTDDESIKRSVENTETNERESINLRAGSSDSDRLNSDQDFSRRNN